MVDSYDAITMDTPLEKFTDGYAPTDSERQLLKYMGKMFDESKRARAHKVPRWRRNEELYNGDYFKPFKLPKYKSRVIANSCHSIVETIYSILTDRFPKVDFMPRREEQVEPAQMAQDAVESEMAKRKALRAINGMKRDALIYGNGFVKMYIEDDGRICYKVPDIYTVFVDPLATTLNNSKCIIFATPTYVQEIRDKYEKGKYVKAEGKLDEFKSFVRGIDGVGDAGQVTTAGGANTGVSSVNQRTDYVEQSPAYDEEGAGEYMGGQAVLKEAWHLYKGKWYITTWCGNILLQHKHSPYDFMPVVMFKNYGDEHHFWGKGEPEIIEPLTVGTAIMLSQTMDNMIYHGNPAWVMSKSAAKHPANRPSDKPGQVFYTNGPHEQVARIPAGQPSAANMPVVQMLMQMTDSISGIHDITQGRNPSGVTASRAIAQLQEASQQIIRAKERDVGTDAMIDIYKMTLFIMHKNYAQNIHIRKESDVGGYEFVEIAPYELDPMLDFKYVPGSTLPESRAQRIDQALDYMQMGLLDPEKFWKWHQKDMSKEILEEIAQAKKMAQMQMQQDDQILQESEDPEEIEEALLRKTDAMGMGQPQEPEGE
ncbi:MAG: putative portal protein [Prokaryotic dsDNA virus sp.]|nr:MAG: putative portal protein [Prokaryotic dsDNA virus sp.]|tara:strand:- start:10439 stop:12226 length:1788 start_codon:yes stop_codon:yes gene_type:complete